MSVKNVASLESTRDHCIFTAARLRYLSNDRLSARRVYRNPAHSHQPTRPECRLSLLSVHFSVNIYTPHCIISVPSVLWCCWLGGRKGIRAVKTEWWGAGMVICLERGADLHMAQRMQLPPTVSCFSKILIGFYLRDPTLTCAILAHLGSPGKRAVKWVCVHYIILYQ